MHDVDWLGISPRCPVRRFDWLSRKRGYKGSGKTTRVAAAEGPDDESTKGDEDTTFDQPFHNMETNFGYGLS